MTQLSTEDYENIFLRIYDRFLSRFLYVGLTVITITAAVAGILGYSIAKTLIEPRVDAYVATPKFREEVLVSALAALPRAED